MAVDAGLEGRPVHDLVDAGVCAVEGECVLGDGCLELKPGDVLDPPVPVRYEPLGAHDGEAERTGARLVVGAVLEVGEYRCQRLGVGDLVARHRVIGEVTAHDLVVGEDHGVAVGGCDLEAGGVVDAPHEVAKGRYRYAGVVDHRVDVPCAGYPGAEGGEGREVADLGGIEVDGCAVEPDNRKGHVGQRSHCAAAGWLVHRAQVVSHSSHQGGYGDYCDDYERCYAHF